MASIASGPPVLSTETYFIHPTFSKCEKRSLSARIQFFSGNIVHRMHDALFIMLPQATSVASMTRAEVNRVRSPEMLEDHLKKKLGRDYSTYLDLPNVEAASEPESLSDPESGRGSSPEAHKPIKPVKKVITQGLDSPQLTALPLNKPTTRKLFTQTELRKLERYIGLHPPDTNVDNGRVANDGRPTLGWWVKLYEDCEWAHGHTAQSWRTWAVRHWDRWTKETAARRKAVARASGSARPVKPPASQPKKLEAIVFSSSESSSEGEGDERDQQGVTEVNAVEDTGSLPEASASNAKDDRPLPQEPDGIPPSVQKGSRDTDTETESSEEDALLPAKAPVQATQPPAVITEPSSPPPLHVNPSRGHLGFACWRRRPRVLVADSDPSQTTATTTTTTTQTTNFGPTQLTQVTSASAIPAAQKSRILTQSSAGASQKPHTQSQRASQAASLSGSGSGSGTSGRNPWIAPDVEDSDGDYDETRHEFDADSDDDGWSENSSGNGTEDEDPESLLLTATQVESGSNTVMGKRHLSTLVENEEGSGIRKLVDMHLPRYFEGAVLEYGATQSQTQTQYQTQATQQSQTQVAGSTQTPRHILNSQGQQRRRRIVTAVLPLVSHWMQIPLPKVRNVWKNLPREKQTFEELQKKCLQCDLSTNRKEYNATGLFTQQSPRSRVRKWNDDGGPARKRRRLVAVPSLARSGSSNTEANFEGAEGEDEESEVYFGGQDPDAPTGGYDEDDGADQEPPPILFRQTRLLPGSAKMLHPYPARPDKEWAKRICRVLAAKYDWGKASKVYEIWEEVGGDAKRVEEALKEKNLGYQKTVLDFGLGDIPRPWA